MRIIEIISLLDEARRQADSLEFIGINSTLSESQKKSVLYSTEYIRKLCDLVEELEIN